MKTINKKVVGYLELKSTNLTTPSNNQIWAHNDHLYVRLDGITYQLDQQSGTGGGHVIQDNGSDKTQRTKLNFKNFTVTDNLANDSTDIEFDTSWIVIPTKTSDLTNDSGFITSSALSGYTPTSRTITINGTTQDLSSNRSWTIPSGVSSLNTLTGPVSIKAGSGIGINISGSDIEITNTGSGINIDGGVSNSTYGTLTPIDGGVA